MMEQGKLKSLIREFHSIFSDTLGRTQVVYYDVDVGQTQPIKQHPYRVNLFKQQVIHKEFEYMLDNGLIEPSGVCRVSWCKNQIETIYIFTDFRRVNSMTKSDSHPIHNCS